MHDYSSFADELFSLNSDFSERFQEFKSKETTLYLFLAPFNIKFGSVSEKFQIVLLEMQGNDTLKHNSHECTLLDSWWSLLRRKFFVW
jgi:hypothetical protein